LKLGVMIGPTNWKNWFNFWWGSDPTYGFRITFPFSSPLWNMGF